MSPTKEEHDAARAAVALHFEMTRQDMSREVVHAFEVFLAATETPTDADLQEEARIMRDPIQNDHADIVSVANRAYVAGAKRLGARHKR
jgi:hypothetical protein